MDAGSIEKAKLKVLLPTLLFSAVLLVLSFPAVGAFPLAFVALTPLFLIVYTNGAARVFALSLFFYFIFFASHLYWIGAWLMNEVSPLAALAAPLAIILFISLCYAVLCAFVSFVVKRSPQARFILLPVLFTLFEYSRTVGFLAFPWGLMGYSQHANLPFIQFADITGVLGISFLLYLANAVIADLFLKSQLPGFKTFSKQGAGAVALLITFAAVFIYGGVRLNEKEEPGAEKHRIAVIQRNFDPNHPWLANYTGKFAKDGKMVKVGPLTLINPMKMTNHEKPHKGLINGSIAASRMVELMKEAELSKPGLTVTPESALMDFYTYYLEIVRSVSKKEKRSSSYVISKRLYPIYLIYNGVRAVNGRQDETNNYVLLGSPDYGYTEEGGEYVYNSALLLGTNGVPLMKSAKEKLVPFGEAYPFYNDRFVKSLPFLKDKLSSFYTLLNANGAGHWDSWTGNTVLTHPQAGYKFSVLVCYESAFGALARRRVKDGAQLLINITDDAWSYSDSSLLQHFSMSVFRAVESRRPVVRCANSGVSAHIDKHGRILKSLPLWKKGQMSCDVSPSDEMSLYSRLGDFFVLLCAIVVLSFFTIKYSKSFFKLLFKH